MPKSYRLNIENLLNGIHFSLVPGEIASLSGPTKAGKTELLKILASIQAPSQGKAWVPKQVCPFIEPKDLYSELTGKENIHLQAMRAGKNKSERELLVQQVAAFGNLHHELDLPLKRFSRDAGLRFIYSLMLQLNPPLLLVDDTLEKTSTEFQATCHRQILEMANLGTACLFVSNMAETIKKMASRSLWIAEGTLLQDCSPSELDPLFNKMKTENEAASSRQEKQSSIRLEMESAVKLEEVKSTPQENGLYLQADFEITSDQNELNFYVTLRSQDFIVFTTAMNAFHPIDKTGTYRASVFIPNNVIGPDSYALTWGVHLRRDEAKAIIKFRNVDQFQISPTASAKSDDMKMLQWNFSEIESETEDMSLSLEEFS